MTTSQQSQYRRITDRLAASEVCREHRGTLTGYAMHQKSRTNPCTACARVRRDYIDQLLQEHGIPEGAPVDQGRTARKQAFAENYLWLIWAGETHREAIAKRLGMSPLTMERTLFQVGFRALHITESPER